MRMLGFLVLKEGSEIQLGHIAEGFGEVYESKL